MSSEAHHHSRASDADGDARSTDDDDDAVRLRRSWSRRLLFPIALATAGHLRLDVMPFAVTVAIAASFAFATPIGYQTNMMVYGPGGYKFTDFIKVGLPLQIVTGALAVILLYAVYFR